MLFFYQPTLTEKGELLDQLMTRFKCPESEKYLTLPLALVVPVSETSIKAITSGGVIFFDVSGMGKDSVNRLFDAKRIGPVLVDIIKDYNKSTRH